jgi:hypothetical protein
MCINSADLWLLSTLLKPLSSPSGLEAKRISRSLFLSVAQQPISVVGRLILEVSISQTIRHTHTHTHTLGRTPLNKWSARRRGRYLHNTQQTQQMNIHINSGIRTRDSSNQAASDLRLRPHGHRDRRRDHLGNLFYGGDHCILLQLTVCNRFQCVYGNCRTWNR